MQLAGAEAGAPTATIGTVFAGQPAAEADLRPGDRVVAVDGDTVQAWDDFNQRVLRSPGASCASRSTGNPRARVGARASGAKRRAA